MGMVTDYDNQTGQAVPDGFPTAANLGAAPAFMVTRILPIALFLVSWLPVKSYVLGLKYLAPALAIGILAHLESFVLEPCLSSGYCRWEPC